MGGEITIGLALFAGFISFISPCVLPLVPAYIGYMGSRITQNVVLQTSAGPVKRDVAPSGNRFQMLLHSLAFVLGFTIIFVAIGLATTAFASALGSSVSVFTDIIGRVGGILIIVFGLHFMGIVPNIFNFFRNRPALLGNPIFSLLVALIGGVLILWAFAFTWVAVPLLALFLLWLVLGNAFGAPSDFWHSFMSRIEALLYSDTRREMDMNSRGGLAGSAMMGVVFSAGWTPCIGPTLGVVLTLAANTGDVGQAVPLLTAYSLGLGIPFILTALMMNQAQGILKRLNRHMRTIQLVSGALLIIIGILVALGILQSLSSSLVGGEFTEFTSRVEECTVGAVQGDVHLNQLGNCIGGSLHPITLNQIAIGDLPEPGSVQEFVFENETSGQAVDVLFTRASENLATTVTLYNNENIIIEQQEDVVAVVDADETVALANVELPDVGQYRVTVENSGTEAGEFWIRVRESEGEVTAITGLLAGNETETIDTDAVVGITDVASELPEVTDIEEGINVGNLAVDFEVQTENGEVVHLSDFHGEVVLLNFWGTWCGPCRREMPEFQSAFANYDDKGFDILAVAVRDTPEKVIEFREEFGLTFTTALDNNGSEVSDLYGVVSQPSTFVIDADGVIIDRHFGILTEAQLQEILNETLDL